MRTIDTRFNPIIRVKDITLSPEFTLMKTQIDALEGGAIPIDLTTDLTAQMAAGNFIAVPTVAGAYANAGGLSVTADELANNDVSFLYVEGVWSREVKNIKGDKGDSAIIYGVDMLSDLTLTSSLYIDAATGIAQPAAGFSITPFIPLKYISFFELNPSVYQQWAFYDENKNYIDGKTWVTNYFQPIDLAKYIRFTIQDSELSSFSLIPYNAPLGRSKNLIDKRFVRSGYYVQYDSGVPAALAAYSHTDLIKINPSTAYFLSIGGGGAGVQIPFFDADGKYLSGLSAASGFTSPAGAEYVIVNLPTTNIDDIQLEEGTIATTAVSGIGGRSLLQASNYITVGKAGGDYATVNEAISAAVPLQSVLFPVTIFIYPGYYNEVCNIAPYYINLVGAERDTVIIADETGAYANSPINMSGRNKVSNLTVTATNKYGATHAIWAYAIHHDSEGPGASDIFNVNAHSDVNAAIGIGLQANQSLSIRFCTLTSVNAIGGSSLYAHSATDPGAANQRLIVQDCNIESDEATALFITDPTSDGGIDCVFTFINNTFWSKQHGKESGAYGFQTPVGTGFAGGIKLGGKSFGNNISVINL